MKAKVSFRRIAQLLLILVVAGSVLSMPVQSAAAKPLAAAFTDCASQAEIPAAECDALVAFYNSTNGAGWTTNTNWLQTDTPCSWYGVTCDLGHVTILSLAGQWNGSNGGLTGTIPVEIGNLSNLTRLDLEYNQLNGSIPAELGSLTNLSYLSLFSNQLSGVIPPELGNLTNLQLLFLGDNQLSGGIPPELGNLTNLVNIALSYNQLSGPIPSELVNLNNLLWLEFQNNQLSGSIPPFFGSMTNLIELRLSDNQLSGVIPPELGNMTSLQWLYLQGNQLSGNIPSELANVPNLNYLYLNNNQLSGTLPPELGNMTRLFDLSLSNNWLSGEIPPSIVNLIDLTQLTLSCGLTSSDPTVIAFIENLVPGWQDNICSTITPVVTVSAPGMVSMDSGQSRWIAYNFTETAGGSGTINSRTSGFYTQGGVLLGGRTTIGTYTYIQPNQTANNWQYVTLPQQVVNKARSQGEIAIVLKTSFLGTSAIGNPFSVETSVLIVLPPDKFSKSGPANGAINQPTNPALSWASSLGATDYEYCIDTVSNNRCDTEWYGTYNLNKALTGLLPNTTYYWHVRAHNYIGNTTASNNGTWWSFRTISTNSPPTNITLSKSSVAENTPIGTVVGALTATDPDLGDTHTFTLQSGVAGCNSTNNASFQISNNQLQTNAVFDYETNNRYYVCIRANDGKGGTFDKAFIVTVTNVVDEITKNGGLEIYSGISKIPTSWTASKFSALDGKNAIKKTGKYSVKIAGQVAKTKTLTQTLNISGTKGNAFKFSYWAKGASVPAAGVCQAQVFFYSGATLKGTKTLKCPTGATYNWKQAKLNFTAPAAYTKVVIKFTYSKTSGMVWFDAVSLMK